MIELAKLKEDDELKNFMPKLSDEEYSKLENDVKTNSMNFSVVVWNNTIVDGYDIFEICKKNHIKCQMVEIKFLNKQDAKLWILKKQLKVRNLTETEKIEIALEHKFEIGNEAKIRRMINNEPVERIVIAREVAKIADVSQASVERYEYIKKHGSISQISRMNAGEPLYRIYTEIKEGKTDKAPTKICNCCGKELPLTEFYTYDRVHYRGDCKKCHSKYKSGYKNTHKDIKGKNLKAAQLTVTEEHLKEYLYNEDKEINYTIDDLLEEIEVNAKNSLNSIASSLEIHKDLLNEESNRKAIQDMLISFANKIKTLGG